MLKLKILLILLFISPLLYAQNILQISRILK